MQTSVTNSENVKIAAEFLGWKPPLSLELATKICDGMTFSEGHFRDVELEKLTKFWLAGETRRTLPNFRTDAKAMFRLLRQFHLRKLFVEIEGRGTDYVVTVYSDSRLEKIVSSGRSKVKAEAVYQATVDFLFSRRHLGLQRTSG